MSKGKTPAEIIAEKAKEETEKVAAKKSEEASVEKEKVEKKAESKPKKGEYLVKKGLGFEKRNYYVNGKNIVLEAGKSVSKEIVNAFHPKYQEIYFEKV